MSLNEPHILSFRNPGRQPEQMETLLRDFFRSEMPDPWPVLKAPVQKVASKPVTPRPWMSFRSRLALAASVALLALASWCFSANTPDYTRPTPDAPNGIGSARNEPIYLKGVKVAPAKDTPKIEKGCGCCGSK
ncbi:MAG: hypothetical protein K2R98_21410 [Gemmataceae bacterium]|nr:hypothetical protein [Gemmataceae bacterium]